jgi:hypothetical protein
MPTAIQPSADGIAPCRQSKNRDAVAFWACLISVVTAKVSARGSAGQLPQDRVDHEVDVMIDAIW